MATIWEAARRGDVDTLRFLLVLRDSPDVITLGNTTLLHCVCNHHEETADRAACLKLLIDAGADLELTDSSGSTALHYAAGAGQPELLSLLIQAGANLEATQQLGSTALHLASWGYVGRADDCVDVLMASGASVNARDSFGRTPLGVAHLRGHHRMWPVFLRAGAEIPSSTHPYFVRIRNAGGFKKYEQQHLARIASILAPTPRLPPEMVRKIVEFWLHAGFY